MKGLHTTHHPEEVGRRLALLRRLRSPSRVVAAIRENAIVDHTEASIALDALSVRGLSAWIPNCEERWPILIRRGGLTTRPWVAVVGARAIDPYGIVVTKRAAADVMQIGGTVVSGGAVGADSLAHQVALDRRMPTFAVIAGGHDHLYPRENLALFREIVGQGGALISPWWPDTPPAKHRFLVRNRLIADLVATVIVTRARGRSGALTTAQAALRGGVPVLAVPGSVGESLSLGCHHLLSKGAKPMLGCGSVAEALGGSVSDFWMPDNRPGLRPFDDEQLDRAIIPLLPAGEGAAKLIVSLCAAMPLTISEIAERSGLGIADLMASLGRLQLSSHIEQLPDGRFTATRRCDEKGP